MICIKQIDSTENCLNKNVNKNSAQVPTIQISLLSKNKRIFKKVHEVWVPGLCTCQNSLDWVLMPCPFNYI